MLRKQKSQNHGREHGPQQLTANVGENGSPLEAASQKEAKGDGGIDMRAGNIAHGVDHPHDDEAEYQAYADMAKGTGGDIINNDGTATGKNQCKSAYSPCDISVHIFFQAAVQA